jgi:hypothetical protein
MVLHALPYDIGDFVEFTVVFLKERMENAPLYRLEAVFQIGNCPVPDYIGCVFKEVAIKEMFYICHRCRPLYKTVRMRAAA